MLNFSKGKKFLLLFYLFESPTLKTLFSRIIIIAKNKKTSNKHFKQMKMKNLILIAFLGFTNLLIAQLQGKVESVLNLGSIDYAYILVEDQGYYKTSAYQAGLLIIGDDVEIQPGLSNSSGFQTFVKTNNSSIGVYALKINTENFTIPINSIYGLPILSDDILWFSSQSHFDEFYSLLKDFSNSPYEYSEDLLKVFEGQYPNFISFNQSLIDKFNFDDGLTDSDLNAYTQADYFKDEILKTLINQFGEIGIGDEIHSMFMHSDKNKCVTLVTNKSDINKLKQLREVEKDEDFKWNYHNFQGDIYVDGKIPNYITKDLYSVDVVGDLFSDVIYTSSINLDPVSCTTTKVKLKFKLSRTTLNGSHVFIDQGLFIGTITVNWGDGSFSTHVVPPIPVTINPSGDLTWHQTELYLTHEYATEGQYNISTSGVFNSEVITNPTQFTMSDSKDWQSPEIACTASSFSDKVDPDPQFSPDHKAICEGWISNWLIAHVIGAKTTNYLKKNGKWKKRQENISAEIVGVFRDNDCLYKETKQEFDSGHERDIQAAKTKWFKNWSVSNGDCIGNYTIEHYGTVYEYELIFNPCH